MSGTIAVLGYIAANVRRLRERRRMTQEQLAEGAELDVTYLQRVERGSANPSARVLANLALALGVSPGRLFRRAKIPGRPTGRPRRRAR